MKPRTFNRRDWMRTTALTAGGLGLIPVSGFCETPRAPVRISPAGEALYSPFFREYLPEAGYNAPLAAKLNANENPYGPSALAREALSAASASGNRYAWRELMGLIDEIAGLEGVQPENIITGPGSSDILEKTAMVFFQQGGNVVSADPSYMSLIQVARSCGAEWKPVPLKADWSHDLEAMEAAIDDQTNLVYICNPNNPTGTLTPADALLEFCDRVSDKVPVFVDEAYLGFLEPEAQKSMVSLVARGKNVIVARTFSKIHGMAGLRVGYAVALPETLERINAITRGGMGISGPSIAAARASMSDLDFLNECRSLNTSVRTHVYDSLKELGHKPVPSYTSFMIFPIALEGKDFLDSMTALQVGVRAFHFKDQNWCRVSMGTRAEMDLFLDAVRKTLV
ncbi:histidinol-phosphate transaminase [Robiginitalea sp. SC105]|uniref:pyridoxal phosphate-dependent aminotransferase n=1 Tax=Robiginitalea sp. SC105 TaxID=2762332 RepID=UPI00163AA467|nr:histidinol-phosphate transaminase [Robiginitalea sp. SC105]MBC2838557.1 histidinol-phosphate aminotransferase family protein [Robiginitalea sp. SC105]